MIDDFAKDYLHGDLREIREAVLRKLDGLSDYDVRRPLTSTGTNLLGLVKHLSVTEARYFGEVFDRPFPEPVPRWDDLDRRGTDMWATEHETRQEITDRYRRAWEHSDATIAALAVDSPGHVPWWPRPNVMLFNVLVHVLTETGRHAGHADILREQLDGEVEGNGSDPAFRERRRAEVERAARAACPGEPVSPPVPGASTGPAPG
ncbi:DinB family protein [Umezawaea endophytica]|uniref:DinB family protein n=1 Tax=Umezawaea endophytica TaxID=1654476 RepID=A0A9X2VNX8_9PSEU|nr:DinB family protein [Umezawaea endophytica]MCS7479497.1 DinB family protein [Umezawaea endophytica]